MRRLILFLALAGAAGLCLIWAGEQGFGPVVITSEAEKKIVLLFGNPRSEDATVPGLSLRIPFLHEVKTFERRQLYLNTEPVAIQTVDGERLVVDNYVVWRIGKALEFHKSFPSGRAEAEARIDRVVRADVREKIAKHNLVEVLTTQRVEIMAAITAESERALSELGIEILDVRINRSDLPSGTIKNVYARMKAERERLARQKRAEGEEEARRIRARADREARVLVAEGQRDAEILKGQGDAEATRIYAESYSLDPEFYYFVRSLEAYRKVIGTHTTLVLPPSHEFFRLFQSSDVDFSGSEERLLRDAPEAPEAKAGE